MFVEKESRALERAVKTPDEGVKFAVISEKVAPFKSSTKYWMYLWPSVTQLLDEMSLPEVRALHEAKAVAPDMVEEFDVRTLTVVEAELFVVHDAVPHVAPPSENLVSKMLEVRVPEAEGPFILISSIYTVLPDFT